MLCTHTFLESEGDKMRSELFLNTLFPNKTYFFPLQRMNKNKIKYKSIKFKRKQKLHVLKRV